MILLFFDVNCKFVKFCDLLLNIVVFDDILLWWLDDVGLFVLVRWNVEGVYFVVLRSVWIIDFRVLIDELCCIVFKGDLLICLVWFYIVLIVIFVLWLLFVKMVDFGIIVETEVFRFCGRLYFRGEELLVVFERSIWLVFIYCRILLILLKLLFNWV